jgi:glycogen operon protein
MAPDGTPLVDDDFFIFVNAWWEPLTFQLPADVSARRWDIVCDTLDPAHAGTAGAYVDVGPRSTLLLGSLASPS